MRRFGVGAALVTLLFITLGGSHRVVAQTVTSDQLAAVALDSSDLPGYIVDRDAAPTPPNGFAAVFVRTLVSSGGGNSVVIDGLVLPDSSLPPFAVQAALSSEMLFRSFINQLGLNTDNFALTGPLGIGDVDQSAAFDSQAPDSGVPVRVYADAFLQGRLVGLIIYVAETNSADPAQLTNIASLQDAKILSSQLPPSITGAKGMVVAGN
jgi:hypothetical protein